MILNAVVRLHICTGMVLLEKLEILENLPCLLHCVNSHALLTVVLLIHWGFLLLLLFFRENHNLDACTFSAVLDYSPEWAQTTAFPRSQLHYKLSHHLKGGCRQRCLHCQWQKNQDGSQGRGKACKVLLLFLCRREYCCSNICEMSF